MQAPRHPAGLPAPQDRAPEHRAGEEARAVIDRAESAWRRQLHGEEADAGQARRAGGMFRWLLLALAIVALVVLLFERLAQIG